LLSILYQVVRCLLGLTAVLVRRDLSKDAELLVLHHENTVLRRRVTRVCYMPADRVWLAVLSRLLPRRCWAEVFRGHSRHAPGLAPQADLAAMGLHRTPPARTSPDRSSDQEAGPPHGDGESSWGHRRVQGALGGR
jgi:putative transposase